jgi:hypothetical protein
MLLLVAMRIAMKLRKCLASIVFMLATATVGFGCSCMFSTPSAGFERAKAVFTGKIIQARKDEWTVEVSRVWKGEVESQIILFDAHARTSCSVNGYKIGQSYLFLANVENTNGITRYSPQVCNWGVRLRSQRVRLKEKGMARWVEDWVLMGHGRGRSPIKGLQ